MDGEDLRLLANCLADAGAAVAAVALRDHVALAEPGLIAAAALDPVGAARAGTALAWALDGPHGLVALAVRLEADAALISAARWRYELVEAGPWRELTDLVSALALALASPVAAVGAEAAGVIDLPGSARRATAAGVTWLTPHLEVITPLLALAASLPGAVAAEVAVTPPPLRPLVTRAALLRLRFVAESVGFRPTTRDPVTGRPVSALARLWPSGAGGSSRAKLPAGTDRPGSYWAAVAGTPVRSVGDSLRRAVLIGSAGGGRIALERVAAPSGAARWIVELPGIASTAATPYPQDLPGALAALALPRSSYGGAVRATLDLAGVPPGADVMLVGHSQGGIVAMDLARDPAFNGGRVKVTHVIAAGAPVSHIEVPARTRVLTLENTYDVVTHLDNEDSRDRPIRAGRADVAFSQNRRSISRNHSGELYADQLAGLADSPQPELRGFLDTAAPYLDKPTSTSAWTLTDLPAGGLPGGSAGKITQTHADGE